MSRMRADPDRLLRMSLVLVWLVTGVVSLVELNGQSRTVLAQAGLARRNGWCWH